MSERPRTPCRLRWYWRDEDWVLQQAWEELKDGVIVQVWRDVPEVRPDGDQ